MKRLIPPFLLLACLLLMTAMAIFVPQPRLIPQPWHLCGLVPLFTGLIMALHVSRRFRKASTEIHTFKTPRALVTDGLFAHSRNPVYLGFTLMLAGTALLLGAVSAIFILLLFILVTDRWYIRHEEKEMERVFGDAYRTYKTRVRRWL